MVPGSQNQKIPVLSSGGRVASLIRSKDWSNSSIGLPESWPKSFVSYLNFILNNKFPLFLIWGKEQLHFYNNACYKNFSDYDSNTPFSSSPGEKVDTGIWKNLKFEIEQILNGNETSINREFPVQKLHANFNSLWKIELCPLHDENGEIAGVIGTLNESKTIISAKLVDDIVPNKFEGQMLDENEERFQIVLNSTDIGSWELNLKTSEIKYSKKYLEILGYREFVNLSHTELLKHLYPDDLQIRKNALKKAYETGFLNYEFRVIWRDKSVHWVETKGQIFYDENNEPLKLIGTLRDITDKRTAIEEMRESEQKFRLLADSVPQLIWTGDADGNLNYFNQSLFDYAGLTPSKIRKDGWIQIVHPDDRLESIKQWAQSINHGEPFLTEHRFKHWNGEYRWHLSRAIPQKDSNGVIQMWVGTSTDVHDQKIFSEELEKNVELRTVELKRAIDELVKTNQELEQFAYVSSHDLQEPLRKIQTFSGILSEKLSSDTEHKFFLDKINASAFRMSELIKDLLNYSRLSKTDEQYVNVDLNEVLDKVKNDFEVLINQKRAIILNTKLPIVRAIPIQMNQLVYNLIGNSLKFCEKKPFIEVTYKVLHPSDQKRVPELNLNITYHHLMFKDNGIGFSAEYAKQIFTIFQRLNEKQKFSGTGIGLAMCKRILENHRGFISAESEFGKGATFHVYLPS